MSAKIYHSFTDKYGNTYTFADYISFATFWFGLSRKYATNTFPDFVNLQKAASNSAEARRQLQGC